MDKKNKSTHDINSNLSAVENAIDLVKDEWRKNPDLVLKILEMTNEKIKMLKKEIEKFHQES